MTAWVRYALMVSVILLGGLLLWLVRSPPVMAPSINIYMADAEPPAGSPAVLRTLQLRFLPDPVTRRPARDYLTMMDLRHSLSRPPAGVWIPYGDVAEATIISDADRLWQSGWLEHLWVDVVDEPFANGVDGKRVVFNLIEREGEAVVPEGTAEVPAAYVDLPQGGVRLYPP